MHSTASGTELANPRGEDVEAQHQVDALTIQIEQTELAIARVARPKGVTTGLLVLGYVTVTGVLAAGVDGSGLESFDWRGAWGVVGSFGSGIVALMLYVSIQVHHLTVGTTQ